ncbi:Potassium transporter [Oopsacas minuta]|uniref:Flavin-containing monooxygenase n=1 Tax=Oopsacas minuta TaxID=111878 RepID=A0AAV7JYB6_9METZ|nr:Potassium transporter [Oopsacas minuta]
MWNLTWRTGSDQYGDSVPNSMYRHMWSNSPKECFEFGDYTFDEHFGRAIPSYTPRPVMRDYIITRAVKADLKKYIKFNIKVVNVTFDNNTFSVTTWDKINDSFSTEEFDFVVVASGHLSFPYVPEYPGMDTFPGRIIHSHDFRNAEQFSGQDLIVIGSSYSAEDIAIQCYKYGAKSITIVYRQNPIGFKWPSTVKEMSLDRLEGNMAYFKDGNSQKVDSIILCTGYLRHFPFLEENLRLKTENTDCCPDLYKGVVWKKNHKLFYLGMQNQYYTITLFDTQAWFVRDVILGTFCLPSERDIQKEIDTFRLKADKLSSPSEQIDYHTDYMKDIFKLVDCPKFNIDQVNQQLKVWEHHRKENILTYRDKSFTSVITGTRGTPHHTDWLHAFDDSIMGFLAEP